MLFNSIDFFIFLPIVFVAYWFLANKNLKVQNALLLVSSYFFYGWWDWRFLSLIFVSSLLDFFLGLKIFSENKKNRRKIFLSLSLIVNLGFLAFFKYYNFFIDSFLYAFSSVGISLHARTLNIILPVGISFYTFQTLSYTLDIYKNKLKPTRDIVSFFAFVSFFPQLVAGPIERAKSLLPQFYTKRKFSYNKAVDGLRQMLWGLFKKVVVADSAAGVVDYIFSNSGELSGISLVIGAVFFAFQIYGDFSGYSDIAIGLAKLFGFNLMRNFAFPYFSRDIGEFWRRWHISLSSWFRDYVYIPLGGSFVSKKRRIFNLIITFTISGFWHGANWTFIFWGFLNGIYYIPFMLLNKHNKHTEIKTIGKILPKLRDFFNILTTFAITTFAWIFFRAKNITHAIEYIKNIFSSNFFSFEQIVIVKNNTSSFFISFVVIIILIIVEWIQREKEHALEIQNNSTIFRWSVYFLLSISIIYFFDEGKSFIYFQF